MKYRYIFLFVIMFGCLLGPVNGEPLDRDAYLDMGSPYDRNSPYDKNSQYDRNSPYGKNSPYDRNSSYGKNSSYSENSSYNRSSLLDAARGQYATPVPADNSIDESAYIIGGGDVFFISFISSPTMRFTAATDRDGNIYIPELGLIKVGNVPLKEAKTKITGHLATLNTKNKDFYVSLIQTKNATVSFTGMVRSPGSIDFSGDTRLLDAIAAANMGELPLISEANLRQVAVQSANTDSIACYDLLAYLHLNDRSQNPYIYPGDRVRINPTTAKVFISGAITTPPAGFYPLKEGETLGGFLSIFTLDNTADTNNIIVFQTTENNEKILNSAAAEYVLNDLDAITIPVKKNHPGIFTASISGEIASPGRYPIIENATTARQLIDKAGGLKSSGNYDQAVIVRPIKNLPEKFNAGAPQTVAVRPERSASITMASSTADYTIVRLILYNADKVIVEPGDHIVIPKKDFFVYISGSVKNPGAYPFMTSKDVRYYVTQAGGYSGNADKTNIQVYLKYGDAIQSIEPRCIEPGSVIVVPASTQYKILTQVILPLLSTLATTIGVGIAIYNSRQ